MLFNRKVNLYNDYVLEFQEKENRIK